MKPHDNESEKTSRRQFGKTIATALVAVPVISALSSCSTESPGGGPTPVNTPTPTVGGPRRIRGGNHPPVIIDGGSLSFSSRVKLDQTEMPGEPLRWKHVQGDDPELYPPAYGHAQSVQITSDFGVNYFGPEEVIRKPVELLIYIEKVSREATPEEKDVLYDRLPANPTPHFRFYDHPDEGDSFTAWFVEKFDNPEARYLDKVKMQKYTVKTSGGSGFRIGRVDLVVAGTVLFSSTTNAAETPPADGFRIIIEMTEKQTKR